jgi:hypothetical protein
VSSDSYEKWAAEWGIWRAIDIQYTYSVLVKHSKVIDLVGIRSIFAVTRGQERRGVNLLLFRRQAIAKAGVGRDVKWMRRTARQSKPSSAHPRLRRVARFVSD